jgi:hypothetical protein
VRELLPADWTDVDKASSKSAVTAETIARMADKGKDVSRFFTNAGRMMTPVSAFETVPH